MLLTLSHGATLVAIALRSNKRSHLQLSLSSCYITSARSSSRRVDWGAANIGPNWSSRASLEIVNSGRKTSGQEPMQTQRCAVITGVARSRGIGRQLAYSFINQGYKVIGVDVQEPNQADDKLSLESFLFVTADVSDPAQAKHAITEAAQWCGNQIHVLINNAAKLPHVGKEDPLKVFADTVAVNLNGAYYMSQCVQPYMPVGRSSIIHISSTRAYQSEPNTEGYSASKAGLCGLTHSQAISLAGKVRVNAILPGWINTDDAGDGVLRPEDHAWHPVGRVGIPEDVAQMCLFLCDEERAGFITGQEFVVDGGVSKKMVYPE